jgi:hypothetical protein
LAKYTLSEDIARLASSGDPEEVVHQSVEYANQHGGSDNITVAVIEIGQPVEADVPTVRRGALPTEVDWDELVTVPSVAMARPRRRRRVPRWQFAVLGVLGVGVVAVGALGLRWILTRGGDLDPLVESMPTHTVAQTATASPAPTSTSNLAATNTPLPTNTPIPTATPDDAEEPSDNLPEPPELKDIPIDELEAGRAKWLTTIETCVYMVQSPEDQDGPDAVSNRFLPAESEEGKDGTYYRINGLVKLLKYKINDTYDEEWKNIDEQLAHQMDENDLLWLGFIPNKTVCEQDFID